MKAVYCTLRLPLFSSKLPTAYQIAISAPLPLSATLIGALVRALARVDQGCSGVNQEEAAKKGLELMLSGLLEATSRVTCDGVTRGTVILKRSRELEGRATEGSFRTDAIRREYVFSRKLQIIYIFKDDEKAKLALRAISLMDRIGDTESIISPVEWGISNVRRVEGDGVNTTIRGSLVKEMPDGCYSIIRAYLIPRLTNWPQRPKVDTFYIPIKTTTRLGLTVLTPSMLKIRPIEDSFIVEVDTPEGPAKVLIPSDPRWL